jgi:hypothetical protein
MSVSRDGINLTKMSNARLNLIVERLKEVPGVDLQAKFLATWIQPVQARKTVQQAALYISAFEHVGTRMTAVAPSPESMEWSNLEGGHVFHQVSSFAEWLKEKGI